MRVFDSIPELTELEGPVVTTVGFFDGVHLGHQSLLAELADFGHRLDATPLVITFANSPKAFHNGGDWRYLSLGDEKLYLLESCGVAQVLQLRYGADIAEMTAVGFFKWIASACNLAGLVAGYDSAVGSDMVSGAQGYAALTKQLGLELQLAAPVSRLGALVKSSRVRRHIAARELVEARQLLGRPYLIQGKVEHGKGKGGKELQLPTANIYLREEKLAPPTGIYAATVEVEGEVYPAAICIMDWEQHHRTVLEAGHAGKPVPPGNHNRVIEAFLIGFSGNLYGQVVRLGLTGFIRDWIDFASAGELTKQVKQDIEIAQELCRV